MHRTLLPSPTLFARQGVRLAGLACAMSLTLPAFAQDVADPMPADTSISGAASGNQAPSSSWLMSGSGRTAIGLNVGRSTFQAPCGNVFACDDTDRYWTIYGRTMANDMWGSEIAFVDMGDMDRGGGTTRARGLNISLVGKVPIAQTFGVFGKVGAMYGRTRTSTAAGADIAGGNENGFGLTVGAGVSWDFSPKVSAVLEVDRYNFRFQSGRDAVNTASVGLQYRY
jgi:opacity protein-like surface antigen